MLVSSVYGNVQCVKLNNQSILFVERDNCITSTNYQKSFIFQQLEQNPVLTLHGDMEGEYISFVPMGNKISVDRSQVNPPGKLLSLKEGTNVSFYDFTIRMVDNPATTTKMLIEYKSIPLYEIDRSSIKEVGIVTSTWTTQGVKLEFYSHIVDLTSSHLVTFSIDGEEGEDILTEEEVEFA